MHFGCAEAGAEPTDDGQVDTADAMARPARGEDPAAAVGIAPDEEVAAGADRRAADQPVGHQAKHAPPFETPVGEPERLQERRRLLGWIRREWALVDD